MDKFSRSIISAFTAPKEPTLDPGIYTRTSRIQLFYGAWVNMAQLAIGLAFGFASIQIPMLLRPDSEIQITVDDASWIVSAVPLMVPLGCVISGFVMDWIGSGRTLLYCQVPMFVGWLFTSLAETANAIIIARAITGVGCGMAMGPSRAYGTEIALPNMRGVIGAFPNLAVSFGITFTATLGKFLSWKVVCYICCAFTFLCFCSFIILPATPYFILKTKTEEDALANLALFRGPRYNLNKEMDQLIDFKQENNLRKLTFKSGLGLLLSKAACKPFTMIMMYSLIAQAAGISIILFWTIDLLEKTHSSMDVHTGNILMGVTRVSSGIFTSVLLYRYGRRPLALISAIGVTIVCCAFGIIIMGHEEQNKAPQICLMVYVVFASLGYYTLPFLMAFELYPLHIRGVLGGATISLSSLIVFASTKLEPFMLETLGVASTFITFGLFSFIGSVFIFFWVPETKDLTLQEIEEYYKDMRPTLSSQRRLESMNQLDEFMERSRTGKRSKQELKRLNRESSSRSNMDAKLEANKKIANLIEKDIEEQLKLSPSNELRSTLEREKEKRESIKSRGITFGETKDMSKDNGNTKNIKPAENKSKKSTLKVIYEGKKNKKDEDEKDKDNPKDEKRDEVTPKDEKRDVATSKDEKRDEVTPKDEKRDEVTPKDEKRVEATPKDEKRYEVTPKDEKKDEATPKGEMRVEATPKDEKRDEATPKDEKRDEATPKDEKRVEATPKDEKRDEATPKDETRNKATPKDEKRDEATSKDEKRDDATPKGEKKDEETPKDEKKDKETPEDENQPSTSKKHTQ